MRRKLLVVLLAMAVLFTFMPLTAYANTPENGWDDTHTYYYVDGTMLTDAWRQIEENGVESWHFFGSDGKVKKGWFKEYDEYYYGDPSTGALWLGWKKIGGYWYYFAPTDNEYYDEGGMYDQGVMQINGKWY